MMIKTYDLARYQAGTVKASSIIVARGQQNGLTGMQEAPLSGVNVPAEHAASASAKKHANRTRTTTNNAEERTAIPARTRA